jgi:hypothetical protein
MHSIEFEIYKMDLFIFHHLSILVTGKKSENDYVKYWARLFVEPLLFAIVSILVIRKINLLF